MEEKRILVISNKGLSKTESNGRVFSLLFSRFESIYLYSYCLGGVLDEPNVKYVLYDSKAIIKSFISFGFLKPTPFSGNKNNSLNKKEGASHKSSFFILLRNFFYFFDLFHLLRLNKIIKKEDINMIFSFGTDASFLYKDAYYLSKKNGIPLYCYTGEDYCFKKYNYINKNKHSGIIFKLNQRLLYMYSKKAFEWSRKCFFTSYLLLERYKQSFKIYNCFFKPLPSDIGCSERKGHIRKITTIVYAGNLYSDRVSSLIKVAKVMKNVNSSITLCCYGIIKDCDLKIINEIDNIKYKGVLPYDELKPIIMGADLLLHIEGFSDYFKTDCKYAFSTKISDYYVSKIPFFVYSPRGIASTDYCLSINDNFVATNEYELNTKLPKILLGETKYIIDYDKILQDFRPFSEEDLC